MRARLLLTLLALIFAGPASATSITLSTVSSDGTPASQLEAEFDFSVSGTTLTLTVTNTGSDFNINQIFFNADSNVSGLTFDSATHSVAGDVLAAWSPLATVEMADGFGTFDFALMNGVGETSPSVMEPGEEIVFVFTISGTGPFADADFIVENGSGFLGAAKFVNGPPDPECASAVIPTEKCPEGVNTEDSGFGAVPEPGSTALLLLSLGAVAAARRLRA